jgi:peptidoglycan/xylan/chitin deacetylase (PgdA/CDA1 family)
MVDIRSNWPEDRKFALCLTHDVDRVDKSWWHCLYYFLETKNPYQIKSVFTKKREMPYWNFERIMDIEREYGVRSTFFFLNETKRVNFFKPSTYALTFGHYKINDPRIIEIIKKLDSGGWEIGVHGSYDSYLSKELLIDEKRTLEKIIGKPIIGIRQHYLNLDVPKTWELQKESGFTYDASFGFRDKVDFREERDLPFNPIGGGFLEIPLAIMDGPLFESSKDIEDAWKKCEKLIDISAERGALLTILWHNNRFNENEYPGQTKIYERIIKECQQRGAWVAKGEEIVEWWGRQ